MLASFLYQKVKTFLRFISDPHIAFLIIGAVMALVLVRSACVPVEKTREVTQTVEQEKKKTVDEQQKSTSTVQTDEQRQQDKNRAVEKHVTKRKRTEQRPDGTVITDQTETTDYQSTEQQHESDATKTTETATQEQTTHVEEQETTKTETRVVEKESSGFGSRLGVGLYLSQDLRSAFRGKLDITPGITAGMRLLGPTRLDLGVDTKTNAWASLSYSIVGLSLSQNLKDLGNGFRPVPGIGVDLPLMSRLSVGANVNLDGNAYATLTARF